MVKRQDKGKMTLPGGYIPLGLCVNSAVATSKLRLRCTGLLKIARLKLRYVEFAVKMHKKRCGPDFFKDAIQIVPQSNILIPEDLGEILKA